MNDEQIKSLDIMLKQNRELKSQGIEQIKVKLTCADCGEKRILLNMYRCFECSKFICSKCGEKHFGTKKSTIFRR